MTDPPRVRRTDPGNPEVCPVFCLSQTFFASADDRASKHGMSHRRHRLRRLQEADGREPDHLDRAHSGQNAANLSRNPQRVWDILDDGSKRAQKTARKTMKRVRDAIFGWEEARKIAGPTPAPDAQKVAGGD